MRAVIAAMNTPIGRAARFLLGVTIIALGLTQVGGAWGVAVALIGLGPIYLGLSRRCMLQLLPGTR